jgi:hypothetical protein
MYYIVQYTYLLHGAESFLKLTDLQLVKKFPAFHGTRGSLSHSQASATCLYPGSAEFSPYTRNRLSLQNSIVAIILQWHSCNKNCHSSDDVKLITRINSVNRRPVAFY